MKICIYGAGAIGGLIGAKLARAGVDVTLIGRGPHLEAMRAHGITVEGPDGAFNVKLRAVGDPSEAGPQDYVIVALKAHAVSAIVERMRPLIGPGTAIVTAVNGVPWWYFYGIDGPLRDRRLGSVDPDGKQWELIGPERAIGCVVYAAAEIVSPGRIAHIEGDRFTLGEPDGSKSERVTALSRAMSAAGLKAPVKTDIRTEIWVKLWGNAAFNPISALTDATLKAICEDPLTRDLAATAMTEVEQIAKALGVRMPVSLDRRIAGAAAIGEHKTSMLQDMERGRSLELDAIVGAVIELSEITGVAAPTIRSLYALTRLKAETRPRAIAPLSDAPHPRPMGTRLGV